MKRLQRQKMRQKVAIGGLASLMAFNVLSSGNQAASYPEKINNCNDSSMTFKFSGSWSEVDKNRVRGGLLSWNSILSPTGVSILSISEIQSGSADVELKKGDLPDGVVGRAECFLGASITFDKLEIESGSGSDLQAWKAVARHEIGHLLGLEHSGHHDSRNGDNSPTMATCQPLANKFDGLSQDDHAYVHHVHVGEVSHANVGFEQGLSFWGKSKSASGFIFEQSGGIFGPGVARFKSSTRHLVDDYIYQTVDVNNSGLPDSFWAISNHRKTSSDFNGVHRIALYSQRLDHTGTSNCSYPFGMAPNNPVALDAHMVYRGHKDQSATLAWQENNTGVFSLSAADGHRLQVRVSTTLSDVNGNPATINIDNVRADNNG